MVNHGSCIEEDKKMYERANIEIVPELAEGVFLASGAQEAVGECRYGRTEFN